MTGGHNLGPVPEEDILGRMITCLTHIYEIEASKRQIKLDGLELKVEGTLTSRLGNIDTPPTYKDIAYSVYISSPETKEKIEELQKAVEATCPIYNMIKDSQLIKSTIVRGPYTEEKEKLASQTK
ncbi:OsmC family protein [Terriglobus sp. 2YAB30_2]|uniref:OsmC family protein n=1 Tax=unclassified Terriglobus TaxID=2628988 RepID=UPI003F95A48F